MEIKAHLALPVLAPRTIIANSQKYSNGTFEEIGHLVREMVSLAEKCCADGAEPSCYDDGVRLTKNGQWTPNRSWDGMGWP